MCSARPGAHFTRWASAKHLGLRLQGTQARPGHWALGKGFAIDGIESLAWVDGIDGTQKKISNTILFDLNFALLLTLCPVWLFWLKQSMGFDAWFSWWFNHLPGPSICPQKDTYDRQVVTMARSFPSSKGGRIPS